MLAVVLFSLILLNSEPLDLNTDPLAQTVIFASKEKAAELLATEDTFTNILSRFDLASRLDRKNPDEEELLRYAASQAREWDPKDVIRFKKILGEMDAHIRRQGYHLEFPGEIYFVLTTAKEEGGATAYTRENYVVFKEGFATKSDDELRRLIYHELFHILSRHNPDFRERMYKIIGFGVMENLPYPENLRDFRITNPDAPLNNAYIRLRNKNTGDIADFSMILYSSQDYDGGSFFDYLNIGFMQLEGEDEKEIAYRDGEAVILQLEEVEQFFEQVGENTQYIVHPEEIMADNFTYLMTGKAGLSTPRIPKAIRAVILD